MTSLKKSMQSGMKNYENHLREYKGIINRMRGKKMKLTGVLLEVCRN